MSDLKGEFFTMNDCRLSPHPQADTKIIYAGQGDTGMDFTAKHADYSFSFDNHAERTRQQTSVSNATPTSLGAFNDLWAGGQ